eukprot:6491308-Amphidinium_carterae.1
MNIVLRCMCTMRNYLAGPLPLSFLSSHLPPLLALLAMRPGGLPCTCLLACLLALDLFVQCDWYLHDHWDTWSCQIYGVLQDMCDLPPCHCVALPHLCGGAKSSKITSLAHVQAREPDQLLNLHEDEYTHTMEVPSLRTCAGRATVTAVNVTSLRQYWEAVVAMNSDVLCLSEVRLDKDQQEHMAKRMHNAGYSVIWGAPPPMKSDRRNRKYLSCGGVAIAYKSHWTAHPIPMDSDDAVRLHAQGRFVAAELVSPGATQRLQVHALYVTADPRLHEEQQWQIQTAMTFAVAHGWFQRYSVLAGDFNKELTQSPLADLIDDGSLACPFDVLGLERANGQPGERKIDHVLCSPPMLDVLTNTCVTPFAPFPGHTPVSCEFVNQVPKPQPKIAIPQPLPVAHLRDFPTDHSDCIDANLVDTLIGRGEINDAFTTWCQVWERYLLDTCQPTGVMSSYVGRGTCDAPQWKVPSAQLRPQACYDKHLHSIITLNKRFDALAHMEVDSADAAEARLRIRRIWSDLQDTISFPPWPSDDDMPWERAAWRCQQYLAQLQKERKALM